MSDFVNRTVKVFDVLTLAVLMEHGDLDYTMVEYWDCTRAFRPDSSSQSTPIWRRVPPTLLVCCLSCLCKRAGVFQDADGNRAALLDQLKAGNFNITRAWLRTSLTQCSGCGNLPHKPLNPNWEDFTR